MWEMVLTQGLYRKDAAGGTFPSDNLVQLNSTKTSLKHRVDWGMLVARSSVSPCNLCTTGTNLPMLTPRISGLTAASLAGTICFRLSQTCTELAQNWERPWKELYRGYKPAESTVPLLMIFQHFAAICTCPPSYWAGHYLCAANQGSAAQNWLSKQVHSWARAWEICQGQGGCGQPHCAATLSTQHRRGVLHGCKDLCQQRSKLAGKPVPKMNKIIWENSQEGADWGAGRQCSGLRVLKAHPALARVTSGSASPRDKVTVLMPHHQAGGMKVADSTELTLDGPRVSASLMVFCTFPSIRELQPELSETLVSCAQQGRCKINRIWSAARDLTRLQRLWYFTEAQNKNQLLL